MKLLLCLLILLECFLVFVALAPGHIHSTRHARAFVNQLRNPTAETERVWQEKNRKCKRQRSIINGVLLVMIFSNAGTIIWTARKVKDSTRQMQPTSRTARLKADVRTANRGANVELPLSRMPYRRYASDASRFTVRDVCGCRSIPRYS